MQYDYEWMEQSLKKLNMTKLKKKCERLSLATHGNKHELISRIMDKIGHQSESSPDPNTNQRDSTNSNDSIQSADDGEKVYKKTELQQISKSDLIIIIQSTFSKSDLIQAIISRQNKKQMKVDEQLKKRNARKDKTNKMFTNAHEKNIKPINFGERMATDYDKIAKQREIIRQLKEKRKGQNDLRSRNAAKNAGLFSDAHEKVIKHKEIKHPKPKKKKNNGNKEKIQDVVSRDMIEKRQEIKQEIEDMENVQMMEVDDYKYANNDMRVSLMAKQVAKTRKEQNNALKDNDHNQSDFDKEWAALLNGSDH